MPAGLGLCVACRGMQAHWRSLEPSAAPLSVLPPITHPHIQISLTVVEAAPSMKGETQAPSYKRAVVEGGVEVRAGGGLWQGLLARRGWRVAHMSHVRDCHCAAPFPYCWHAAWSPSHTRTLPRSHIPTPSSVQVQVPPFVNTGDSVVVDTAERTFVRRG